MRPGSRIENRLEILSIHIPKTGGSSFQKTLQTLYGEDAFQRLDFTARGTGGSSGMAATNRTSQDLLDSIYKCQALPANIRVLHGHFHYKDFTRFFELNPETRVVTWLREPVQRIVSNYHYLLSSFEREVRHTPLSRQLFKRLAKSLPEFARNARDTNLYQDYLRGRELADYDFVGIIEDYENELDRLGRILGVDEVPRFRVNRAMQQPPPLDDLQKSTLMALNETNMGIYHRALGLKTDFTRRG